MVKPRRARSKGFTLVIAAMGCTAALALPAIAVDRGLVVLTETGQTREGVAILKPHPSPDRIVAVLTRGFSGRLLRLYRYEQEFLRRAAGISPEPAYLLLSSRRGGFPRFGFFLGDEDKRQAGFVDLHKDSTPTARFGAMDQIFPHELAHIIVHQLVGTLRKGGSNQLHAIGVRTDPCQAFSEGFAEHMQVMAIDDPDADPATRALAADSSLREAADAQARRYRKELEATWALAGPMRTGFLIWYSGIEQVWRYHAVREGAFAHQAPVSERMLASADLYPAYLLQNVVPGDLQAPAKSAGEMLATEGVVSTLFYRWSRSDAIGHRYRERAFYDRFGAKRSEVTPLEDFYLKLFYVLFTRKPSDTVGVIEGYKEAFPDEAPQVDGLVQEVLLGQKPPQAPELWLANPDFQTGTSLFDQYRSLPRTHTFDLNSSTLVDLLGVPGMNRVLAEAILSHRPYPSLDAMQRTVRLPLALLERFRRMELRMADLMSGVAEEEAVLSLSTILWSYGRRALIILGLAMISGAFLYRRARSSAWWRAGLSGFTASLLVLGLAWLTTGTAPPLTFLAPIVLFGVPTASWELFRRGSLPAALRALLAWAGAAIPAFVLAYPWF